MVYDELLMTLEAAGAAAEVIVGERPRIGIACRKSHAHRGRIVRVQMHGLYIVVSGRNPGDGEAGPGRNRRRASH